MDFKKWEAVVVEWANCLNVSDNMNNFIDLQESTFFFNLLSLLQQDESINNVSLDSIKIFLKDQYPNCTFESQGLVELRELNNSDLILLSSLLLHYSCIIDRREVLTSPLCNTLSETSQICIKAFLEHMKDQVTTSELFNIISICIKLVPRAQSMRYYALQAGDSHLTNRSPLQVLLRTPAAKSNRLQQKDKEITKLLHQIDLERFDKDELQDKLDEQKNKNLKLRLQMDDKIAEIVKLRSEVCDLENNLLPHENQESRELQQRLKNEVINLEKYINKLENEQEELHNDRDAIKTALKKAEANYILWQDKALNAEQNLDHLLEKHQEQDTELAYYKAQCIELNAFVKEMRSKRQSTESLEVDCSINHTTSSTFSESVCEEDACVVIEIQLKEARNENTELKNLLKQSESNINTLNSELNIARASLKKCDEDYNILVESNKELIKKVSILEDTQQNLLVTQHSLEECRQEISKLVELNATSNNQIMKLEEELDGGKQSIASLQESNASLSLDLKITMETCDNINLQLNEKTKNFNLLEETSTLLQSKYNQLMEKYHDTDFNLQSLHKTFSELDSNMERSLLRLEKFIYRNNPLDMRNKGSAFTQMLTKLEENELNSLNEKQAMINKIADFETLIKKLEADLNSLKEKEVLSLKERTVLSEDLQYANKQICTLESGISDNLNNIQGLNEIISDMQTMIEDLKRLEKVVEEKDDVIEKLQTRNSDLEARLQDSLQEFTKSNKKTIELQKSLETYLQINADFKNKISECQTQLELNKENENQQIREINELKSLNQVFETQIAEIKASLHKQAKTCTQLQQTILQLENQKRVVEDQLIDSNNTILEHQKKECLIEQNMFEQAKRDQETILDLNTQIENYTAQIAGLEKELQSSNLQYSNTLTELEEITAIKQTLEEDIELNKEDFNKRVAILDSTIAQLEQNLKTVKQSETHNKSQLDEQISQYENLKFEMNEKLCQIKELEDEAGVVYRKITKLENECQEKDDLLSKENQNLLIVKLELEQKSCDNQTLRDDLMEQKVKADEAGESIRSLNEEIENLRDVINEFQQEQIILQNLNAALQKKCSDFETNTLKIVSDLSDRDEQLQSAALKLKEHQEATTTEISNLKLQLKQSQNQIENLLNNENSTITESKLKITELQSTIIKLNETIESLNRLEIERLKEIRLTQDELSDTVKKYTESLQSYEELKTENESQVNNLMENLHEIIEKYNRVDKIYTDTALELENKKQELESLEHEKSQLEFYMLEQKAKYEANYNRCATDLTLKITELTDTESRLNFRLDDLKEKLENSKNECEYLDKSYKSTKEELSVLQNDKVAIRKTVEDLYNSHTELIEVYNSLKGEHKRLSEDSTNNLKKLKVELVNCITKLANENQILHNTINVLKTNIDDQRSEKDEMCEEYETLVQRNQEKIEALEEEKKMYQDRIEQLVEEKAMLEGNISEETYKLNERKKQLDDITKNNFIEVNEYKENIIKLKCAINILETGKVSLDEKVCLLTQKIDEIEQEKTSIIDAHEQEINFKDGAVEDLNEKNKILESQLHENITKQDKLKLELCTLNELLKSLTEKHLNLEKLFKEENEDHKENLHKYETDAHSKELLYDNLKSENLSLLEEMIIIKSDIENLQQKIKGTLLERDSYKLEIDTIKEKLLAQESKCRLQETTIAEINTKLLTKLSELLEVQNEKRITQEKLEEVSLELALVKKNRDEILDSQIKVIKETENNLIRAHEQGVEVKNELLNRINELEMDKSNEQKVRCDVEKLLNIEKVAKEILEIRVLELTNEKSKFTQLCLSLKDKVGKLAEVLNLNHNNESDSSIDDFDRVQKTLDVLQEKIVTAVSEHRACVDQLTALKDEKVEITKKIELVEAEKKQIDEEKEQLVENYNTMLNEKLKVEQEVTDSKIQNENFNVLEDKIQQLQHKLVEGYEIYKKCAGLSSNYNSEIEQLISERIIVEEILSNLNSNLSGIKMKYLYVSDIREQKRITEQIESYEIIVEDIQKQFLRLSKKINNIISTIIQLPIEIYNSINAENINAVERIYSKYNFADELEKVNDCKDRAKNLLLEMEACCNLLDKKVSKSHKENVLQPINNIKTEIKDDELRKKNLALKQKLTLTENAKSNLEKKLKQIRETKSLNLNVDNSDHMYKILLRDHIQTKEEYEKLLNNSKNSYDKLLQEFEEYKAKRSVNSNQVQCDVKLNQDVKLESEIIKLRGAYSNLMSDNSKLNLENTTLRKLLEEHTLEQNKTKLVKDAYEKLLEENNKLRLEVDTTKYKRSRDREAFMDNITKENKKIEEVRNEYESKLEKMKDKMVQLYRNEVHKEMQKAESEKTYLSNTIQQLQQSLQEEKSRTLNSFESRGCDFCGSRESLLPLSNSMPAPRVPVKPPVKLVVDWNSDVKRTAPQGAHKCTTLPKSMEVNRALQESISKRNTVGSMQSRLEMEDEEDDLFNNKYLADLKEGRCVVPSGRESNISNTSNINRLSELKWRNSLCPPHLKSSYPAETQFHNPKQFKDEDIKSGVVDFDDSMSSRLLPGEKPRKKDAGTTSYKKPGPPTPSKNGGRLSLQGNEICPRDVLREHNDNKTPKRTTPSRLKALFMGRNSNIRENSENQSGTPKSRRLSIFRKQK